MAAREAERGGKHRRAAELYAEALRVLLDKPPARLRSAADIADEVSEQELHERRRSYVAATGGSGFQSEPQQLTAEPPPVSGDVQPRHTLVRRSQKGTAGASEGAEEGALISCGELDDATHLHRAG